MTKSTPSQTFPCLLLSLSLGACAAPGNAAFDARESLAKSLLFYASFDDGADADFAVGDPKVYSRVKGEPAQEGLSGEAVVLAPGLSGDALDFRQKSRPLVFYRAQDNVGYSAANWSGAISFWLQLDPATDLEPGYCDPIQITDTRYNDASIWVDFTKVTPRQFRLGVIGDWESWNPDGVEGNDNPEFVRRLIPMSTPPFARGRWTHVLIEFADLNSPSGRTELFVDGQSIGSVAVTDPFTWDESEAKFKLGLSYVGLMDEVAVFDRPLSAPERELLRATPSLAGVRALR